MNKPFKLLAHEIKPLAEGYGSCIASDKITVDGLPVRFMYREEPDNEIDSGWRFMSGTESGEYAEDACNFALYDVNTIANYDLGIISLLSSPIGSAFERPIDHQHFIEVRD
jgi:hypothetical protein